MGQPTCSAQTLHKQPGLWKSWVEILCKILWSLLENVCLSLEPCNEQPFYLKKLLLMRKMLQMEGAEEGMLRKKH